MLFTTAGVGASGAGKRYNLRLKFSGSYTNDATGSTTITMPLAFSSSQVNEASGTTITIPITFSST